MTKRINPIVTLIAGVTAIFLLAASSQERSGLHVFIISKRAVGQVEVDQRVEGPFRGTATDAGREEARLNMQLARQSERVRTVPSVYRAGQCILVYQQDNEVLFRVLQNPSADIDRRLRMKRQARDNFTIKLDTTCL